MNKFILPFIFISSILLFTACPFVATVREFKFDEEAFHEAKQKWQDNKLSDYSLKYTFDGATPCLVIGNMKVSNGEGIIEKLTLYWDSYIREGSKYYRGSYNDKGELELKEDTDGGTNFEEHLASIEKRYSVQLASSLLLLTLFVNLSLVKKHLRKQKKNGKMLI
ncbi:MAG: hypothetical protein IJ191_06555 [Treponema sp.]|nr:hypothetical protein [Treponema sp.]